MKDVAVCEYCENKPQVPQGAAPCQYPYNNTKNRTKPVKAKFRYIIWSLKLNCMVTTGLGCPYISTPASCIQQETFPHQVQIGIVGMENVSTSSYNLIDILGFI